MHAYLHAAPGCERVQLAARVASGQTAETSSFMRPSNRHPNQLADATIAQRGLNASKAARTTFTHNPIRESGQPTAHRANDATVMKRVTRYAEGTLIVTRTAAFRNPRQASSQSRPTTRIPASPTSKRSASIVVV